MNNESYFISITEEINALQNRLRNYIECHWLSDGEWKESILRTMLRRHLPSTIGIGTGFVVSSKTTSSQIDILLYDNSRPVLFRDSDFVIVTPDCVRGMIEVKTKAYPGELNEIFTKMADNVQISKSHDGCFFGVFFYEGGPGECETADGAKRILKIISKATCGSDRRKVNCVSIGESFFVRYWITAPGSNMLAEKWRAYWLHRQAAAYFIHNVIEHLSPESVLGNNEVWYPWDGKEKKMLAEIARTELIGAP